MSTIKSAVLDAVLAALPVAVVYFSGWAYLSSYLGLFGVDATQVEIPITTVLVYAFIPLNSGRFSPTSPSLRLLASRYR